MTRVAYALLKLTGSRENRELMMIIALLTISLILMVVVIPTVLIAVPTIILQAGSDRDVDQEAAHRAYQHMAQIEQWCYAATHENLDALVEHVIESLRSEGVANDLISIALPDTEYLRIKASEVIILWSAEHGEKEPDDSVRDIIADFLEVHVQLSEGKTEGDNVRYSASIGVRLKSFEEVLLSRNLTPEQEAVARIMLAYQNGFNQMQGQTMWLGNDQTFNEGDLILDGGVVPLHYFHQRDGRWDNQGYAGETIAAAGCGPTAVAMVVSSLLEKVVTPAEVARWSDAHGYAAYNNGSYHSLIPSATTYYGLTVSSCSDPDELKQRLAEGSIAIAIMGPGAFTPTGHFIVLRGIDEKGRILVADPVNIDRSRQQWDVEQIMRETQKGSGSGGPIWVVSK